MANPKPEIKHTQLFINNEWVNSVSGKTFATINPTNEEKIATIQEGDKVDVDKAVAAAQKAFELGSEWRRMDASARGVLLNKLAALITRDLNHLASLETIDNGKPFIMACRDMKSAIKTFNFYGGYADKITGKTIPADGDFHVYTRLEPIGVVGLITPWNGPMVVSSFSVASALAAGNVVILKPAEQTPLTALYLASLIKEAGFPSGVFNVIPGYGPTAGAALSHHPNVDMVAFTGSREVGKLIQEASAKTNLKRVTLELGGKSPLVISQHCDLATAVEIAELACFFNQGQACCAGTRIFVHESIHDSFVEETVKASLRRKLGDPFAPETIQGSQIDQDQFDRIFDLIESGKKEGATLKCGGKRFGNKGFYVEPTVFTNVKDNMRIAKEEIFGPVMSVFKYKTLAEVIERANDTEYGLGAGIVSKNIEEVLQFSNSVRSGFVWVNNYYSGLTYAPFGGYKQSGIGRVGGEEGILEYCQVKTVSIKIPQKNA